MPYKKRKTIRSDKNRCPLRPNDRFRFKQGLCIDVIGYVSCIAKSHAITGGPNACADQQVNWD